MVMLTCVSNAHARCGCLQLGESPDYIRDVTSKNETKAYGGKPDLFDKYMCQVRLLQLSEAADHLLHVTGAQVLLDGGHRCRLVAHSFCLTPRGAAICNHTCTGQPSVCEQFQNCLTVLTPGN